MSPKKMTAEPPAKRERPRVGTLNERVADEVGMAIVTGRFTPGTVLPNEIEASLQRGVSRTAYREAIRVLAAKGLVVSRPKTGTRVNPRARWNILDPDVLGWMFAGAPSAKFVQGLFELRRMIEPEAAALAAERRSPQQLAELQQALGAMEKHGLEESAGRSADEAFHRIILEAADNEALAGLSRSITSGIRWTTIFKYQASRAPPDPIPAHRRLCDAIAGRDGVEARAASHVLLDNALADIKPLLPERT